MTEDKFGKILSEKTYKKIVSENPNKNKGKTAYSYIYEKQNAALVEAYENFINSDNLEELKSQFEDYKQTNSFWLEKDALYEALIVEHNNDYWPNWQNDQDKNLFNPQNDEEKIIYSARIEQLKQKYYKIIDSYCFSQFLINKQSEETRLYAQERAIKMIADRQVAFSDRDTWAYRSIFLDGWCLGCPPDYFSEDGQAWGFPVVNPDKMFNQDGTLAQGGILLKQLYLKMFKENPGGVRIDHIVGLIDPWVYKSGHKPKIEEGASRLYSSPEHKELGRFAIASLENLNNEVSPDNERRIINLSEDQVKKYGAMIEKIVIASAIEAGLNKDAIVCEDLGTLTNPVEAVLKKYDLLGMRLTQFVVPEDSNHPYRAKNIVKRSWAMVGTHDNEPVAMWAKKTIENKEIAKLHAKNLTEDLWPDANENCQLAVAEKLSSDSDFLTLTKLVELFSCQAQNIQIFFADFFGIYDVYNKPGTSGDSNWCLRVPNDFENYYFKQIQNKKGINLPYVLKLAMEARGSSFTREYSDLIKKLG